MVLGHSEDFKELNTKQDMTFTEAKIEFDNKYCNSIEFNCFLPEHLTFGKVTTFRKKDGSRNEQYYKWQFLYGIVYSGLYPKDLIGTEIHFPKGNKNSSDIIIDAAIFRDASWLDKYKDYHYNNNSESLDWLRKNMIATLEFKKEDNKNISEVWEKQLKAYLKESEADFCLGVLYDTERLYLFRKENGKYLRLNDEYNLKGDSSTTKDMCLHLPDPYRNIPNFDKINNWTHTKDTDYSKRTIYDLDIISGLQSTQLNDAMSAILRTLDKLGMADTEAGFEILIHILALKIYDEKRNEKTPRRYLDFYILPEERSYDTLADKGIQTFLERMNKLREDAKSVYHRIFQGVSFDIKNQKHVAILVEVVKQFQDYSFRRSQKTDLYQLVFYKFAGKFSKDNHAQFVTPLPMIDFLVNIVNPRNGETVIDPTVGIADFLSVSYVNSNSKLDDGNIFGMDISTQMVMLATLNMLLNGDGNAKIEAKVDTYGSLLTKFDSTGGLVELIPSMNKYGDWDNRPDNRELKKFDVVLTNPPFGEDRAYVPKEKKDLEVIQCYELWKLYGQKNIKEVEESKKKSKKSKIKEANKIDLGVVFLENAYRILRENGRLGIVLSNSIAGIDSHRVAREWLMERMRIVALIDMPAGIFAETPVKTTIIVAYKPSADELKRLNEQDYEIFVRSIAKVGYEVKTIKRVKYFATKYKINYDTFETEIDEDGNPVLDEDFSQTVKDFRNWCKSQEITLQNLFIKER